MVITENLTILQQIEPIYFSDGVDLSERNATISFFVFSSWIMPIVYNIIFVSTMPRINEDLRLLLQHPTELIGDWLCYKDFIVIRVYGFEGNLINCLKYQKDICLRIFKTKIMCRE